MTVRLEQYVAKKCLTTPNLKIAQELGIDDEGVDFITVEHGPELDLVAAELEKLIAAQAAPI